MQAANYWAHGLVYNDQPLAADDPASSSPSRGARSLPLSTVPLPVRTQADRQYSALTSPSDAYQGTIPEAAHTGMTRYGLYPVDLVDLNKADPFENQADNICQNRQILENLKFTPNEMHSNNAVIVNMLIDYFIGLATDPKFFISKHYARRYISGKLQKNEPSKKSSFWQQLPEIYKKKIDDGIEITKNSSIYKSRSWGTDENLVERYYNRFIKIINQKMSLEELSVSEGKYKNYYIDLFKINGDLINNRRSKYFFKVLNENPVERSRWNDWMRHHGNQANIVNDPGESSRH